MYIYVSESNEFIKKPDNGGSSSGVPVSDLIKKVKDFLNSEIYPNLDGEKNWVNFRGFLEDEAEAMKKKYGY